MIFAYLQSQIKSFLIWSKYYVVLLRKLKFYKKIALQVSNNFAGLAALSVT